MIAIVEGLLLAVCIGLLLRAWWWIRIKDGAIRNYIRREHERIDREIERERIEKEKIAAEEPRKDATGEDTCNDK
jgi:hypothetical protein